MGALGTFQEHLQLKVNLVTEIENRAIMPAASLQRYGTASAVARYAVTAQAARAVIRQQRDCVAAGQSVS